MRFSFSNNWLRSNLLWNYNRLCNRLRCWHSNWLWGWSWSWCWHRFWSWCWRRRSLWFRSRCGHWFWSRSSNWFGSWSGFWFCSRFRNWLMNRRRDGFRGWQYRLRLLWCRQSRFCWLRWLWLRLRCWFSLLQSILNRLLSQLLNRWLLNTFLFNFRSCLGHWLRSRFLQWRSCFFQWRSLFFQCRLCILLQIYWHLCFCISLFD